MTTKKRTNLDRQLDNKESIKTQLIDNFRIIQTSMLSSEDSIQMRNKILSSDRYKKLPIYMKEYLRGYWDSLIHDHSMKKIVFSYIVDGRRLSIHSEEYNKTVNYQTLDTTTGKLVYADNLEKIWF